VDSQLCAGLLEGGQDTCQGDSGKLQVFVTQRWGLLSSSFPGGPLQITLPSNRCVYYLVGVTSFGKSCGLKNETAIYTRVSSYIGWIESVVWGSATDLFS
jgi:Trypsin